MTYTSTSRQAIPTGALPGAWRPILTGEAAARATAAIEAITTHLQLPPPTQEHNDNSYQTSVSASLAGGDAGLAILYTYLAQAHPAQGHETTALAFLERAIDTVASMPAWPSLYSGFTGVAWATEHLTGRLIEHDADDPNEAIDAALLEFIGQSPWNQDYDLISGLVGFGVYALERLRYPSAAACVEQIVARLAETAEPQHDGLTWWTNPLWLPAETQEHYPQGYYNLGLAHGVPGVIALLADIYAAKIATTQTRLLLEGAVRWLLAQRLPEHAGACFSYWIEPAGETGPSRLAWCYGDAGIAASLMYAARQVGEPAWERAALAIAANAAERSVEQSGVRDAGLCHGAAGLGHIFNRFFHATGDDRFAIAARFWIEQTLDMQRPGEGIAGFQAWAPGPDGQMTWMDDPGILSGAAGVALALLAATTPIEPAWDRMLLVSIPPSI